MGKKGSSSKKAPTATGGPQMSVTMREASTGKKRTNTKSSLKLQHIKNLAVWASHEAAIPSLGAFFGHHLAASSEALAAPVDPSLFTCQRCESVLHPGYNCTIRIEKNKNNARHKGNKIIHYPQNNIVYTCHFCSHRNMKRGTLRNTSQPKAKAPPKFKTLPKVKTQPKSTNQNTSNTVSSSDMNNDNVVTNIIAAPLRPIVDEPNRGEMRTVVISESVKVKNGSADVSNAAAPLGSTVDNPDRGKMGILEISETVKVKGDSADINTMAATLGSTEDDPGRCKLDIVEISETLKVNSADISTIAAPLGSTSNDPNRGKTAIAYTGETLKVEDDSAVINTIAALLGSTADDPGRSKMGIVEISQTLKVRDDFANINTITAPLRSTANNPDRGSKGTVAISETLEVRDDFEDINTAAAPLESTADDLYGVKKDNVETNEMLKVKDNSADINTITAPLGSTADDPRVNLCVLEMSEKMEVKNDPAESCPTTPLARPKLTLLESKMKKRNRSGAKKKGASERRSEASNAEKSANTSKRKRRKSWTSLKEIAEKDENDKRKRRRRRRRKPTQSDDEIKEEEDDDEEIEIDVQPIGNAIRVSGEGDSIKNHFIGFQADGISYNLEDTVLVSPQGGSFNIKPSVAIIKDITATQDGSITVTGQRFYRPELAEKENGENWKTSEARELFYSFDKDEFPAEAVMHKCLVHFVPLNKKIPSAKDHPGFIVREVYNLTSKRLNGLLDTSYAASQQNEINVLIKRTFDRIPICKE